MDDLGVVPYFWKHPYLLYNGGKPPVFPPMIYMGSWDEGFTRWDTPTWRIIPGLVSSWQLGSPPFICHGVRPVFPGVPQPQLGYNPQYLRSPWLLTTYPSPGMLQAWLEKRTLCAKWPLTPRSGQRSWQRHPEVWWTTVTWWHSNLVASFQGNNPLYSSYSSWNHIIFLYIKLQGFWDQIQTARKMHKSENRWIIGCVGLHASMLASGFCMFPCCFRKAWICWYLCSFVRCVCVCALAAKFYVLLWRKQNIRNIQAFWVGYVWLDGV